MKGKKNYRSSMNLTTSKSM